MFRLNHPKSFAEKFFLQFGAWLCLFGTSHAAQNIMENTNPKKSPWDLAPHPEEAIENPFGIKTYIFIILIFLIFIRSLYKDCYTPNEPLLPMQNPLLPAHSKKS